MQFAGKFSCSAIFAGVGRSGKFSGELEDGGGVVSKERARAGHRNFQRGDKFWRHHHAADRAVDHAALGLAGSVRDHWRNRICVAVAVAAAVSQTGGASTGVEGGTGVHPQRPGDAGRQDQMGKAAAASSDVDVCGGKISARPGVVVLPFLDSGFSTAQARLGADADRVADYGDLSDFRCGQRRRRLAVVDVDQARQDRKRSAQDNLFGMRDLRAADHHCLPNR